MQAQYTKVLSLPNYSSDNILPIDLASANKLRVKNTELKRELAALRLQLKAYKLIAMHR
jgi:hypothetical protein